MGSVVVALGLSCSVPYGILPDQGSNQCPPALQGRFLTTGPPENPGCDLVSVVTEELCSHAGILGAVTLDEREICVGAGSGGKVLPALLSQRTTRVYSEPRELKSQHHPHRLQALAHLVCPIAPFSVFQGPRFMTSEYNSKYLKEPSHQPGRQMQVRTLATIPPHIPTPDPWGGNLWGPQSWHNTKEASAEDRKDTQAAWGNYPPRPDLCALGLPISKGQLTCLGWLLEACPSLCSPHLLSALDSGAPTSARDPGGSGFQILGAASLPTYWDPEPWQPYGWDQLVPGQQGRAVFCRSLAEEFNWCQGGDWLHRRVQQEPHRLPAALPGPSWGPSKSGWDPLDSR